MDNEGQTIQCSKCGKTLPREAKFCNGCGADVVQTSLVPIQENKGESQQTREINSSTPTIPPPKPKSSFGSFAIIGIIVIVAIILGYGYIKKHPRLSADDLNKEVVAAVVAGDANRLTDLLNQGGDANSKDTTGVPVLIIASLNGKTDIVKILLGKGANANAVVSDGESALMAASSQGYLDIVQELTKAKADLNLTDNDGWSALEYAVNKSHREVADYLKKPNQS
jgi:uncharacterized membrane protein YvbJ